MLNLLLQNTQLVVSCLHEQQNQTWLDEAVGLQLLVIDPIAYSI